MVNFPIKLSSYEYGEPNDTPHLEGAGKPTWAYSKENKQDSFTMPVPFL